MIISTTTFNECTRREARHIKAAFSNYNVLDGDTNAPFIISPWSKGQLTVTTRSFQASMQVDSIIKDIESASVKGPLARRSDSTRREYGDIVLRLAAALLPRQARQDWLEEQRGYMADLPSRKDRTHWVLSEIRGLPAYVYTVRTASLFRRERA